MLDLALIERTTTGGAPSRSILGRTLRLVMVWRRRARDRRVLTQLDDRMLHDIGLTRADIDCEIAKPFWQI